MAVDVLVGVGVGVSVAVGVIVGVAVCVGELCTAVVIANIGVGEAVTSPGGLAVIAGISVPGPV